MIKSKEDHKEERGEQSPRMIPQIKYFICPALSNIQKQRRKHDRSQCTAC